MKTVFEAEGRVPEVDPLSALVACWRESSSGILRFARGAALCGFDLEGGEVVAVLSSDPRFETSAILVRAGKLSQEAVDRLAPQGGDLALAALQAGILTRREWKWGEKIRAIEVLSDLLGWNDGTYRWDSSARPQTGDFRLPIPRLLLELFLRSRDRHLIDHHLGPSELPLERTETFDQEFPSFGLTADAESVVRLIDGRATAAEIAEKAPAEDFAVRKLLAALVTLRLVRSAGSAAEPEEIEREEPAAGLPPLEPEPPAGPEQAPPEVSIPVLPPPEEPPESGRREEETWSGPAPSETPAEPAPAPRSPLDTFETSSPAGWEEQEPAGRSEPSDIWDTPPVADLPRVETAPTPERTGAGRGRGGVILAWMLGILAVAVGGVVLFRGRETAPAPMANPAPSPAVTFPAPVTAARIAVSPASPESRPPAAPAPAPVAAAGRARSPVAARPRPGGPTPVPQKASAPPDSREAWVRRAERDRRRLQADRQTRYAIQLELVCETVSLSEAWRHDRAAAMWLLPATHGGRACFRVFWGRYRTLEAARRAKTGIPAYFVTPRNRPAVVAVR